MSTREDADRSSELAETFRVLAKLMSEFRRAAIYAQSTGVYAEASANAVPQFFAEDGAAEAPAVSFFVDVMLHEPGSRGQTSLGASLHVLHREGEWRAICDLGWEFGGAAGKGPTVDWDYREVEGCRGPESARFFSDVLRTAEDLLGAFRSGVNEYAVRVRGGTP